MSNFRNFETTKDAARATIATTASQTTWTPASGKRISLNAFSGSVSAARFSSGLGASLRLKPLTQILQTFRRYLLLVI